MKQTSSDWAKPGIKPYLAKVAAVVAAVALGVATPTAAFAVEHGGVPVISTVENVQVQDAMIEQGQGLNLLSLISAPAAGAAPGTGLLPVRHVTFPAVLTTYGTHIPVVEDYNKLPQLNPGMDPQKIAPDKWYRMAFGSTYLLWKPGVGWYDSNKWYWPKDDSPERPNGNGGTEYKACWKASSSNQLQWWIAQNRPYIDKYFEVYSNANKNLLDSHTILDPFNPKEHNAFLDFYDEYFVDDSGYQSGGNNWFLTGEKTSELQAPFKPGYEDKSKGYFTKVFNTGNSGPDYRLTDYIKLGGGVTNAQKKMSDFIINALLNNRAVGFEVRYDNGYRHAVTLWGAEINKDGLADYLYYSDSDEQNSDYKYVGRLQRLKVLVSPDGRTLAVSGDPTDVKLGRSPRIISVSSLDLGRKAWEKWYHEQPGVGNPPVFTVKDDGGFNPDKPGVYKVTFEDSAGREVAKHATVTVLAKNNPEDANGQADGSGAQDSTAPSTDQVTPEAGSESNVPEEPSPSEPSTTTPDGNTAANPPVQGEPAEGESTPSTPEDGDHSADGTGNASEPGMGESQTGDTTGEENSGTSASSHDAQQPGQDLNAGAGVEHDGAGQEQPVVNPDAGDRVAPVVPPVVVPPVAPPVMLPVVANPLPLNPPIVAPAPAKSPLPALPARLAGSDRVSTSLQVWKVLHSDQMVLVGYGNPIDALSATPLAAYLKTGIVYTHPDSLTPAVAAEIKAQGVHKVTIIGGNGAISPKVELQLAQLGVKVERIAGSDRYATAAQLAKYEMQLRGVKQMPVFLSDGLQFADAVVAGPVAAQNNGLLLLVNRGKVSAEVKQILATNSESLTAFGGPARAAVDSEPALRGAQTIAGADRYKTAEIVAKRYFKPGGVMAVVSGTAAPDAVVAGPLIAAYKGGVVLTRSTQVPVALENIRSNYAFTVVGGQGVVSNQVAKLLGAK